jgi:hypothetical protein
MREERKEKEVTKPVFNQYFEDQKYSLIEYYI